MPRTAPSAKDLGSLLFSKHLSNSLLIIATHQPPAIPDNTLPTVRVLRLKTSLAIEQAGAVRFVNVLEWAERVARLWRKYGGYGVAELSEDNDGQDYLLPPSLSRARSSQSTPASPSSSYGDLTSYRGRASMTSIHQTKSRASSITSRLLNRARQLSLPVVDPSQRPFDGLINFLPPDVSDKALLKQSILVTTISRPFLISSAPRHDGWSKSRLGSRSVSSFYMPSTPPFQSGDSLLSLVSPQTRAHLIHVLPLEARSLHSFTRSKFVQSLESFLLSFGYPASLSAKSPPDDADRPRPYIMTSASLGEIVSPSGPSSLLTSQYSCPSECTLAELVLCGSLDGEDAICHPHGAPIHALTQTMPRALLTRASDVVLLPEEILNSPAVVAQQLQPAYQSHQTSGSLIPASVHRPMPALRDINFSSSGSSSMSSTTSSTRSGSGSPLARGDQYGSLGYPPTPPDSEESSAEYGAEDLRTMAGMQKGSSSLPPIVTVTEIVHTGRGKVKKTRWKFWRRTAPVVF